MPVLPALKIAALHNLLYDYLYYIVKNVLTFRLALKEVDLPQSV